VEDERRCDSAFVAEVLIHIERGIAEIGPAGAIGGMGAGLADDGQLVAGVKGGFSEAGSSIEAEGSPFVAGAIIGEESDDGVVEFIVFFEVGDDATDALVNMLDHGGEGRHAAGEILASVGGEVGPFWVGFAGETIGDVVAINGDFGERWEGCVGADEAEFFLALETFGAEDVPTFTISFEVFFDGVFWSLNGEVGGGMGEVEEPRLVIFGAGLFEEFEGVVGEDVGDIEVVFDGEFGLHRPGEADVVDGIPLVFGVGKEVFVAVVILEATVNGAGGGHVPFPDHPGGISVIEKHLGKSGTGGEEGSLVSEAFSGRLLGMSE